MIRWRKSIFLLTVVLLSYLAATFYFNPKAPTIHSKSAVLMDASTGDILFEKDATTSYPVASMSKLMTMYIVLDWIENGSIHWDDRVTISENANKVGGNAITIPVDGGDTLTVHDLFKAMVIPSANNATIALAEYIAGTEEAFTLLMNEKALILGLSDQTYFVNSTGLPNSTMNHSENRMSAKDVTTLAYNLLKSHPHDVLETANIQQYHIQSHDIDVYSTNKMLSKNNSKTYFKGMDGLKTGFTDAAGYSFAGTAIQNDKRLISVIMDAENDESRFIETKKLFSYGFNEVSSPTLKERVKSFIQKPN